MRRPEVAQFVTPDLIRAVPVLFTSATFLAGLLTNFGALLQTLYLSGDMEFLLAAPVPARAVFVAKLIQAVLPNFLFMSLFNLPALIGLGIAQGYNVTYFVMLPVTLVLLMLAGAGISAMGVMVVVRVVPARRVAEVLGLVGGVISLLCSAVEPVHASGRRHAGRIVYAGVSTGWHGDAVQYAILSADVAGASARRFGRRAMVARLVARWGDGHPDAGHVCRVVGSL